MMSNDSKIYFIVAPYKNIMVCCLLNNNFSDFMAAILNFMFYKKSTRMRTPRQPKNHPWGTSQA